MSLQIIQVHENFRLALKEKTLAKWHELKGEYLAKLDKVGEKYKAEHPDKRVPVLLVQQYLTDFIDQVYQSYRDYHRKVYGSFDFLKWMNDQGHIGGGDFNYLDSQVFGDVMSMEKERDLLEERYTAHFESRYVDPPELEVY